MGGLTVRSSNINSDKYRISFTLGTNKAPGSGADGMSYSFSDDGSAQDTMPSAENGTGTKLKIGFDSYSGTTSSVRGIRLLYNSTSSSPGFIPGANGLLAFSSDVKPKPAATELIKEIKRRTRRLFSSEEKIRIVLEGLRGEESIAAICRKYNIHQNLYFKWSKDFMEAGKKRLSGVILFGKPTQMKLKN